MTRYFLRGALSLGLLSLALGWYLAGYWFVALALLLLISICLLLLRRMFRPTLGLLLTFTIILAAIGLWGHLDLSLAMLSVICLLIAWDLDGFARRLAFASPEDDPQRLERQHLAQINLLMLLAVLVNLVSQSIHAVFNFEWALGLAILAFLGIIALVNHLRAAAG